MTTPAVFSDLLSRSVDSKRQEPLAAPSKLELPSVPLPNPPPAIVVKGVLALRRALHGLADALCPADVAAFDHLTGLAKSHTIAAIAKHGVADVLGEEALTSTELAERTGLDPDALHRALRAMATTGFFRLRSDGRFVNTRLSRALRSGLPSRIREFAAYFTSASHARSWGDLSRTLVTGEAAFDRLHGMTMWQWFEKHRDEEETFAHVMMGITLAEAPVIASLYPWHEVETVCDVGGGRGTLLSEVLLRHPKIRGTLCESRGVLASARELLTERGVQSRVDLVETNFFESVPSGADAFLLKNIMHDWDDAACGKILAVVRESSRPGTKLVLCESLVERNSRDPKGTLADLHMMVALSNGRERGVDDFRSLMRGAGFRLTRVYPYPTISIIEGVAV